MTLTHDEIAAMTCEQVNKEIAIRREVYVERAGYHSPEYCEKWEYAGRLLEEIIGYAAVLRVIVEKGTFQCHIFTQEPDGWITFDQTAPTPTEAIARCWLEWWEVTHD